MIGRHAMRSLLLLGLAASLAGCSEDMSDLRTYAAEIKARKSDDIEPIPRMRTYEPFAYRPADRREPFVPFAADTDQEQRRSNSGISPDFNRNREPLEEFPLDALRMAGSLKVAGTNYALVSAPDGVVHRVTVGNHMGKNFGEIVAIDKTGIRLVEIVPDGLGGYMKRDASIALEQ